MGSNKKPHQPEKPQDNTKPQSEKPAALEGVPQESTALVEALGKLFEEHGVKTAVAAFALPNSKDPAHVFYVGHFYDVAKMNSMVNRRFVEQVRKELG